MRKTLLLVLFCIIGWGLSSARDFEISLSGQFASMVLSENEYKEWKDDAISGNGVLAQYTKEVYEKFEDDFDFIIFQLNEPTLGDFDYYGKSFSVSNDVSGIGMAVFDHSDFYGSQHRLQQIIHMPCYKKGIINGPFLHEILHRWGQHAFATIDLDGNDYSGHWGLTGGSTNGQLGGFQQNKLMVDDPAHPYHYSVSGAYFGENANGGNSVPYNDIELYLMGMIPLDSVANFTLFNAVDSFSYDKESNIYHIYSDSVTIYDKNKIANEVGERLPSSATSQKDFKALFIIVSNSELTCEEKRIYDQQISQFCQIGDDESHLYNFWEATRGLGTFTTGNISQSLKKKNEGISLLSPSAGEDTLYLYSSYLIEWESEGVEAVSIDLYSNGCFLKNLVVEYPADKGSYLWNVEDVDLVGLSNLRFLVRNVEDKEIYSYSESSFTVKARKYQVSGVVYDSLDAPVQDAVVTCGTISPKLECSNENRYVGAYVVEFSKHYTKQSFVPTSNSLNGLDLVLTVKGEPDNLTVGIMDSLENVLWYTSVSKEDVYSWKWNCFPFSKCVNVVPGGKYYIFMEHKNVEYGENYYCWALDEEDCYLYRIWSGDGKYVKTDKQGRYSFEVMDRWSGLLSAYSGDLSFERKSFENVSMDIENQDFRPASGDDPTCLDDILPSKSSRLDDGAFDLLGRKLPAQLIGPGRSSYPSVYLRSGRKYIRKR